MKNVDGLASEVLKEEKMIKFIKLPIYILDFYFRAMNYQQPPQVTYFMNVPCFLEISVVVISVPSLEVYSDLSQTTR